MRGAVICTICVVLQAGGRHKRLGHGHRIECAMMIVAALGYPATMSLTACASSTKGGSLDFGSFDKFTFRYTPVLRPRRCPALGDPAPVARAGGEGRGRRATEGRRRPVGRSLRRRRAFGGLRTRNLTGRRAGRRPWVGGPDREVPFGRDPARLLPRYSSKRSRRRPGNEPSRENSMTSAMTQASQSLTITTSAPPP